MKKYAYYRPAGAAERKKQVRKKSSVSFLKTFLLFILCIGFCVGGYLVARRAYEGISASRLGQWKPEDVHISGVTEPFSQEINAAVQPYLQRPFSVQDAVSLQQQFQKKYPQFRRVSVKRGLMTGNLNISIEMRRPLAYFTLEGNKQFIDQDGTVYQDSQIDSNFIPKVQFKGEVPAKLGEEVTALLESALKLKGQLSFESVTFDLMAETVQMQLPDGSLIDFGPAKQLRQKARRAAQIEHEIQAQKPVSPHELDFSYFGEGKVFLRQKAH